MKQTYCLLLASFLGVIQFAGAQQKLTYPIVDTAQIRCYDDQTEAAFPKSGAAFFGQDAHYEGTEPTYRDNNGDGYISDDEAPKGPPPRRQRRR